MKAGGMKEMKRLEAGNQINLVWIVYVVRDTVQQILLVLHKLVDVHRMSQSSLEWDPINQTMTANGKTNLEFIAIELWSYISFVWHSPDSNRANMADKFFHCDQQTLTLWFAYQLSVLRTPMVRCMDACPSAKYISECDTYYLQILINWIDKPINFDKWLCILNLLL